MINVGMLLIILFWVTIDQPLVNYLFNYDLR